MKRKSLKTLLLLKSKQLPSLFPILSSLIASSCCPIQLLLNSLSLSCAGFAILNPLRLPFTLFTVILLISSLVKYGVTWKTSSIITLSILVTISPYMLDVWSQGFHWNAIQSTWEYTLNQFENSFNIHLPSYIHTQWNQPSISLSHPSLTSDDTSLKNIMIKNSKDHPLHSSIKLYHISISKLKCEGCTARIKQSLLKLPGVISCQLYFHTQEGLILVQQNVENAVSPKEIENVIKEIDWEYKVIIQEQDPKDLL